MTFQAVAESSAIQGLDTPDLTLKVRDAFGLDSDMEVPGFSQATDLVPDLDTAYQFDHETTMAILAGFAHNRRVMIQGYHGTGKSTHIEQVAARLNWPCIRVNLDSHISRIDLIARTPSSSATASRSPNFARASCPGRCSIPAPWSSTNTMPADPT